MTVESYIQLLRNMKKGMWTVVMVRVLIQWLLESVNGEVVRATVAATSGERKM